MKNTLASLVAVVALVLGLSACAPAPTDAAPPTLNRPSATAAPSSAPGETARPAEHAPAPAPVVPTLTITGVESMAYAATLDPPTLDGVFEIRDAEHGYAGDSVIGPRFLLAHATSPGREPAPGNAWQELREGDRIEALGSIWRIAERIEAPKNWPTDNPVLVDQTFGAGPGTLILITCVPRWEGRATHNLILIAQQEGTR